MLTCKLCVSALVSSGPLTRARRRRSFNLSLDCWFWSAKLPVVCWSKYSHRLTTLLCDYQVKASGQHSLSLTLNNAHYLFSGSILGHTNVRKETWLLFYLPDSNRWSSVILCPLFFCFGSISCCTIFLSQNPNKGSAHHFLYTQSIRLQLTWATAALTKTVTRYSSVYSWLFIISSLLFFPVGLCIETVFNVSVVDGVAPGNQTDSSVGSRRSEPIRRGRWSVGAWIRLLELLQILHKNIFQQKLPLKDEADCLSVLLQVDSNHQLDCIYFL